VLAVILLLAVVCSTLHALARPLWNDEIITVIVAGQPTARGIWDSLVDAADTNPPAFYFAARLAHAFIADDHLAHRLPSIAGLVVTMIAVYVFLSRRVTALSALVGATFLLVTPLGDYATEARPYALMIACLATAMLCWQRADEAKWYAVPLAAALAASVSLHYYAVFAWPAFAIAEGAAVIRRRFRPHVWFAIAIGITPLIAFAPLLRILRDFYGQNYWARTSLAQGLVMHDWLFLGRGHWGSTLMFGLSLALLFWLFPRTSPFSAAANSTPSAPAAPPEEYVLVLMTLWMPAIAVVLALASGAGLTERHFLPAVVGGAMAVGLIVARLGPAVRMVMLALFMASYLYSAHNDMGSALKGTLFSQRRAKTAEVDRLVNAAGDSPLTMSSALEYLEAEYFATAPSRSRLRWLADPNAAVEFSGSASPDLALIKLQHWFPLHVEAFQAFAATHREFVLAGGKFGDWWPERLLHDGHRLQVLSFTAGRTIYKVTMR
jgi:hypothetical protein